MIYCAVLRVQLLHQSLHRRIHLYCWLVSLKKSHDQACHHVNNLRRNAARSSTLRRRTCEMWKQVPTRPGCVQSSRLLRQPTQKRRTPDLSELQNPSTLLLYFFDVHDSSQPCIHGLCVPNANLCLWGALYNISRADGVCNPFSWGRCSSRGLPAEQSILPSEH